MPRFILIDPWLADVGGHNYQYALDILQSAEEQGYEAVLAVNRSLSQSTRLPDHWKILRLFHFGMCSRYWLGPDGRRPKAFDLDGRQISETDSAAARFLTHLTDAPARFDRRRRILDLSRGCSALLDQVDPSDEDVLFLPSMSEFDLIGVVRFLRDDPRSVPFVWHLQFHFNIFSGRDPEFSNQTQSLRRIQHHFRAALDQIPDHQLRFYATTEQMARQFDHIGIAQFTPLPYPVRVLVDGDHRLKAIRQQTRTARPLRVTFAGAMRREKGKKQFASLITAAWPDCLASRQMEFVFQAPPRQVLGWIPRHLRNEIVIAPPNRDDMSAHLRTVQHPLDAQAYHQFIQQTDIGLFLYDSRRYFARASGILGEMLAAGIPTIVPAGCWLADQLAPQHYDHVESLCQSGCVIDSSDVTLRRTSSGNETLYQLPHSASDLAVQFQIPDGISPGAFFRLTAESQESNGSSVRTQPCIAGPPTYSKADDANDASSPSSIAIGMVVPVPEGARQMRLSLAWAYHQAAMPVEAIRVTALSPPDDQDHHPRSRVGLIFSGDDSVPELLLEVQRHYQHYRQSAEQFATPWLQAHHPRRTIELLESAVNACVDLSAN